MLIPLEFLGKLASLKKESEGLVMKAMIQRTLSESRSHDFTGHSEMTLQPLRGQSEVKTKSK